MYYINKFSTTFHFAQSIVHCSIKQGVADQCKSSFHCITIRGQRKQNFFSIASEYALMKFGSVKRVYF